MTQVSQPYFTFRVFLSNMALFSGGWVLLILLYWPARQAGFEGDFAGWLYSFSTDSFDEIFHRKNYKVQSLYQLTMTQLWIWTQLFGKNYLAWFLLQTGLHVLNAFALFAFLKRFLHYFLKYHIQGLSVACSLFFMVGYTHVEPIVWKGAFHYLNGVLMILVILNLTLMYLKQAKSIYAVAAVILFAISCFSLEIFYLTPLLAGGLVYFLWVTQKITRPEGMRTFKNLVLPMLLCFLLYYLLYIGIYQKAIAHYNLKSHIWSISYLLPKWRLYPMRILFFDGEFSSLSTAAKWIGYVFMLAAFISSAFLFIRLKTLSSTWQLLSFFVFGTALALAIVTPLGYDSTHQIRNGHYAYTASVFLLPLLPLFLFALLKNFKTTCLITSMMAMMHIYFVVQNVHLYQEADAVFKNILHSFPDNKNEERKVILAMPSTYKGIVMVGADTVDRFAPLKSVFTNDSLQGEIFSVSAYNMENPNDEVIVKKLSPHTFQIYLTHPQSRWYYRYFEPFDFHNEIFNVQFSNDRHSYTFQLTDTTTPVSFYYYAQNRWHKLAL